jgi:hypothetical protein
MNLLFKKQSGSIAIEALASLLLLFIAVYSMWGVSVFIYNQSRISTATQLAAQAGIIVANRDLQMNDIQNSAEGVFMANLCGMIPGQSSGGAQPGELSCLNNSLSSSPEIKKASLKVDVKCSSGINGTPAFSSGNCFSADRSLQKAVEVSTKGSVIAPFSLTNSLGGIESNQPNINDSAAVYSYSQFIK